MSSEDRKTFDGTAVLLDGVKMATISVSGSRAFLNRLPCCGLGDYFYILSELRDHRITFDD